MKQNLELSDKDIEELSMTDCAEIWRLFAWFHSKTVQTESEEAKQENQRKINVMAANFPAERFEMKKIENGEAKDGIYKLYYRFMSKELVKAKFLIPMQNDGEISKPDEDGKTVLNKGVTIKFTTMDGKYDKPAVRMYTDWKRLRMVYGTEWGGFVRPIEGMINWWRKAPAKTEYETRSGYGLHHLKLRLR